MRPTSAIVRLSAIRENYRTACRLAPGSQNIAVIKSNAYGHGAVEVARALHGDAPAFAVAFFEEAVELREAGITKPILILQGILGDEKVAEAASSDFWLMLNNQQQIGQVVSSSSTQPVRAWLKVETGMHRLGLEPEDAEIACEALSSSGKIQPGLVLCTQLACADVPCCASALAKVSSNSRRAPSFSPTPMTSSFLKTVCSTAGFRQLSGMLVLDLLQAARADAAMRKMRSLPIWVLITESTSPL